MLVSSLQQLSLPRETCRMRRSILMNSSTGPTHGLRAVLDSDVSPAASTRSSGLVSIEDCPTPSCGSLSTSLLMENRFVGEESNVKLVGTPISYSGKNNNLFLIILITPSLLRLCFALYLITIILFIFLIRYAAILMAIMGFLMIFACFAYGVIILNIPPLVLPWNRPHCPLPGIDPSTCNIRMAPALHWCWYLTLVTGLATFFLALLILFLDFFFPRIIAPVFHHNIVEDDDFFAVSLLITIVLLYSPFPSCREAMKMTYKLSMVRPLDQSVKAILDAPVED